MSSAQYVEEVLARAREARHDVQHYFSLDKFYMATGHFITDGKLFELAGVRWRLLQFIHYCAYWEPPYAGLIYGWTDEWAAHPDRLGMSVNTLRTQRRQLHADGLITCGHGDQCQVIIAHWYRIPNRTKDVFVHSPRKETPYWRLWKGMEGVIESDHPTVTETDHPLIIDRQVDQAASPQGLYNGVLCPSCDEWCEEDHYMEDQDMCTDCYLTLGGPSSEKEIARRHGLSGDPVTDMLTYAEESRIDLSFLATETMRQKAKAFCTAFGPDFYPTEKDYPLWIKAFGTQYKDHTLQEVVDGCNYHKNNRLTIKTPLSIETSIKNAKFQQSGRSKVKKEGRVPDDVMGNIKDRKRVS